MNDKLCFIRDTLVPDLRESGRDATADDFEVLCDHGGAIGCGGTTTREPTNQLTMFTIWKFELADVDEQVIEMPQDAKILSTQVQVSTICLWAIVDTKKPRVGRQFITLGTGQPYPLDCDLKFIGTVQQGSLVWHIFEVGL
jgi:hypothetical protein